MHSLMHKSQKKGFTRGDEKSLTEEVVFELTLKGIQLGM
jgi:hypothetical protein